LPRFDRLEFDPQPGEGPGDQQPAAEGEPDEVQWLRKADADRRRGLYENALRYYSRALEFDKSLLSGWLGQIQMLIQLGEDSEAELWARKALELFRGQGDLLASRAQALARIGDQKQALELCDAALKQEGASAYRWLVRGELMVSGRDEVDRHCFDKAVQADPDWLVPLEIALVYLQYDVPSKGQLRAHQAVEKAPQSFYCWYIQGRCEQALALNQQAARSFRRCLELAPKHVEATRHLDELARAPWSLTRSIRRLLGSS
jgi:tetratricopeptide (TPR) repeat protein